VIGFGYSGTYAALGNGSGGFGGIALISSGFGSDTAAGGWANSSTYPRMMADINGDGRDDIVGFGYGGVYAALNNGAGGFGNLFLASTTFGSGAEAGGWANNDLFTRTFADINGDGRADIVGFGYDGVYAALGNGDGSFQGAYLAYTGFGANVTAGGWTSNDHFYRTFGDVNGDGRDDIIGFGYDGIYAALANGSGGFGSMSLVMSAFGTSPDAGGWNSYHEAPRMVVDIDGDGRDEVVGFAPDGVHIGSFASGWVLV
jgi:hypothetical protein